MRWAIPKLDRAALTTLYVFCIGALALGLLAALAYVQFHVSALSTPWPLQWPGGFVLVCVAVFAEKYLIRIRSGIEVSASFLAILLSIALVGPLAGYVAAAVSPILLARRKEPLRSLWYSASLALVAGTTGLCYWLLLDWASNGTSVSSLVVAIVGVAAGVVYQALNFAIVAPIPWFRRGITPLAFWREAFQPFLPFHFFFLAISLGLIYIYRSYAMKPSGVSTLYSTLLIIICLLPVMGLIYAFRAFAHQRELAQHNEALALRNEKLFLQAVKSQVTALDVKDNYTARHSAAVAQWATDIAQAMALSQHQQNVTHLASLVHDVGKIGVPDEVLNFPGRLEGEAWRLVETHCQNGHKILKTIDQMDELADVILYHHEKFDGSGYPTGLAGDAIPLLSRIICVADSYSAMVSDRPYRKALPVSVARGELRKHAGGQFDPAVVDVFLGVLDTHGGPYQTGNLADFDLEFSSDRFLRELEPERAEVA